MSVNRVCKFRKIIDCKACQAVARNRCSLVHRTGRTALQDRSTSFFAPRSLLGTFFYAFWPQPRNIRTWHLRHFFSNFRSFRDKITSFSYWYVQTCNMFHLSQSHQKNIKKYALHHAPKILF